MLATAFTFMLTACEKDNTPEIPSNSIYQDIEGVIEEGQTIEVTGKHLRIPEGKSLTINAGATIIFSDKGVGTNKAPIEFTVDGNLYCLGTEEKPVMLTVAEELRTEGNTFALRLPATDTMRPVETNILKSRPTILKADTSLPTQSSAMVCLTAYTCRAEKPSSPTIFSGLMVRQAEKP